MESSSGDGGAYRLCRAVLDAVREAVFMVQGDGVIEEANSAVSRVFGYEPKDLVGKPFEILSPGAAPRLRDWLQEAVESGDSPVISSASPILGRRRNGTEFSGEAQVIVTREDGQAQCALLFRDLTNKLRVAEQLNQSEQRFRTLVENSPLCIHEISLKGELISMNQAGLDMLCASSESEVVGVRYLDCVCEVDRPRLTDLLLRALEGTSSFFEFTSAGENPRVFSSCFTPIFEGDSVSRLMGITEDITERVKAAEENEKLQAQFQQAQKLESLGVLAGGIAHDFNNLLMGVLGNASMALERTPVSGECRPFLERIEGAAMNAADLCRQMLAYAGKGKFVTEPIDVSELVEEMAQLLAVSLPKTVVLKSNLSRQLPAIEADVSQVRQVIMNLITNAAEAIGSKSGVVTVSTGAMEVDDDYLKTTLISDESLMPGCYVTIEVADTGCGMNEEIQSRIFEPFYSTKETGRGLGLAAVLGILRGHQGALKIYSEPGQGTTIKALFPASEKQARRTMSSLAPDENWRGGGRVLVIDDEETVRAVVRSMLEHMGFEVVTAKDGPEGLSIFREDPGSIRLVLLDMTMPHMPGSDVFRELRLIRSDIKVILASGHNEEDATHYFIGKGLAGFVQKPFRTRELVDKVRSALEQGS